MNKSLPNGLTKYLVWFPELGYGWHPAEPMSYDGSYWDEYKRRDASEMGALLTNARVEFAKQHWGGELVDIGIGGGRFVREADCYGFDVNDNAIDWLVTHKRFVDPYKRKVEAISCWDSLEHISNPIELLNQVNKWVFVSLPIFKNCDDVVRSKHYKPGEHIWYFTNTGFITWMQENNFYLVEHSQVESLLGRDGIISYAFRRKE